MATLSAQFCTPDEQRISALSNAPLHCLTRNESIALAFIAQSGALSLFACIVTFALILRNILYHARRMSGIRRLINVPMDVYLELSLFTAETILSIGGFVNGKWVQDGKVQVGGWCSAQGASLSVGSINVAFTTLAIAVHTFVIVWCNKGLHAIKIAYIAVGIPWIYSIIYVAIIGSVDGKGPNVIFRPSPYWCWIGKHYMVHRVFGGYLWMWTSLFTSLLLYVPLFFWARGNITIGDKFWQVKIHKRQMSKDPERISRHAYNMIAYPLAYALQILPLSVARWIGFVQESRGNRQNHVPPTALIAVQVIYCLSGAVNVSLFLLTRPNLLLFRKDGTDTDQSGDTTSRDSDSIEGYGEKPLFGQASEL